jgi:hypothetical protein
MKPFVWKRVILDPEQKEEVVWKKIKEYQFDLEEIENLFCDNKSAPVTASSGNAKA